MQKKEKVSSTHHFLKLQKITFLTILAQKNQNKIPWENKLYEF